MPKLEFYYIKKAFEFFSSKETSTCSLIEVYKDIPLKSALTGYFLWFLLTSTAVLKRFKGTFKKYFIPYINVVP